MGVWFTSDTHFQHSMVAGLRGFASAEEHDEAVIGNWNRAVSRDDVVWHLGDVGMRKPFLPLIGRLNGTVHLIAGNHDAVWPGHREAHKHQREWLGAFASVQPFARRKIGERQVLLSHFPYTGDHTQTDRHSQYRLRDEGIWLLHGHTHGKERLTYSPLPETVFGGEAFWRGRQVHVGLDAWELRPVAAADIEALIRGREREQATGEGVRAGAGACGGLPGGLRVGKKD